MTVGEAIARIAAGAFRRGLMVGVLAGLLAAVLTASLAPVSILVLLIATMSVARASTPGNALIQGMAGWLAFDLVGHTLGALPFNGHSETTLLVTLLLISSTAVLGSVASLGRRE